jgi:hypothetical protein
MVSIALDEERPDLSGPNRKCHTEGTANLNFCLLSINCRWLVSFNANGNREKTF